MRILDVLAPASALVMIFVGYPAQIVRIRVNQSSRDLSLTYLTLSQTVWILWTLWGVETGAWPIIASNVPGAILNAVVLVYWFRYRDPHV